MSSLATLHVLRWPDGQYSVMRGLNASPVVCVPYWRARGDGEDFAAVVHRFKHVGAAYCQLADCPPVEMYEHAGVMPPEAECP